MTQLGEAVDRYHKILESDAYKDLAWAHALHERMKEQQLTVAGKPISPVLRPHFITRRQYTGLTKAAVRERRDSRTRDLAEPHPEIIISPRCTIGQAPLPLVSRTLKPVANTAVI